jgi:hypothetical protein
MIYYVDAINGLDTNNGTSTSTAWQTTTKVGAFTFSAGDSCLFKRGQTFTGGFYVNNGGTAGNPVTYGAYGTGANPIISGGTNCNDRQNITFQNLDFTGATGLYSAGFLCEPTYQQPQNIILSNCNIYNNGWAGIWFNAQSNITVAGITITNCNIYSNTIFGILITGQDATHRITGLTISNSHIYNNSNITNGQHGIHIDQCTAPVVTGNEINGNTGSLAWSSGLYISASPSSVVQYNYAHDNNTSNIHFDVNSNGFNCSFNTSTGRVWNGFWIERHLIANGISSMTNNTSYHDNRSLYIGPGDGTQAVTGVTIQNNNWVSPTLSAMGIDIQNGGNYSDNFNNNVNNNFYSLGSAVAGYTVPADTSYTLAQWQTYTGFDINSGTFTRTSHARNSASARTQVSRTTKTPVRRRLS